MRYSASNPIKYNRIIIAEALLLTLVIHAVLLFLFGYEPAVQEEAASYGGRVTLLPLNQFSASERAQFNEWLELNDPTIIARSGGPNSYSTAVSTPKYHPPLRDTPLPSPSIQEILPPSSAQNHLDSTIREITQPVWHYPDYTVLLGQYKTPDAETPKNEYKAHYPLVQSSVGAAFSLPLSTDEQKELDSFRIRETVVKLTGPSTNAPDIMPRFELLAGSGRRSFDQLAIKLIRQEISRQTEIPDSAIYTVYWQKESK